MNQNKYNEFENSNSNEEKKNKKSNSNLLALQQQYNDESKRQFLQKTQQNPLKPQHQIQSNQYIQQQVPINPQQQQVPIVQQQQHPHLYQQPPPPPQHLNNPYANPAPQLIPYQPQMVYPIQHINQNYISQIPPQHLYPNFPNNMNHMPINKMEKVGLSPNQMLPQMVNLSKKKPLSRINNNSRQKDISSSPTITDSDSNSFLDKTPKYVKVSKNIEKKDQSQVNKDKIISKLTKQLQFYKELANRYTPKNQLNEIVVPVGEISLKEESGSLTNELRRIGSEKSSSNISSTGSEQNEKASLNIKNLEGSYRVNIFDDDYIIKTNWYINSLYHRKTEDDPGYEKKKKLKNKKFLNSLLKYPYYNDFQKQKATSYVKMMIVDEEKRTLEKAKKRNQTESINENIDNELETKNKQTKKFNEKNYSHNLRKSMAFFKLHDYIFNTNEFIEDEVDDELNQSLLLKKIISHINSKLPKYSQLNFLKDLYYKELYISLPCFDIETLENCLEEILIVDPKTEKVTIKLVGKNIKDKLANVIILLLITKMSSQTIKYSDKIPEEKNSTMDHFLEFGINLLLATDPENYISEHTISALCFLKTACFFSADFKFIFDFVTGNFIVELSNFIYQLALKFGLFDLKSNPDIMKDKLRLSHCEKLQLHIIKVAKLARISNSHLDFMKDVDMEVDIQKVFNTKYQCNNQLDSIVVECSLKNIELLTLINDCYSLFYTSNNPVLDLKQITERISTLNEFVSKTCSFEQWEKPGKNTFKISNGMLLVDRAILVNTLYFEFICIHRAALLRLYQVLEMAAKDQYIDDHTLFNKDMVVSHLFLSVTLSIGSVLMLEKYVKQNEYKGYIVSKEALLVGKCISAVFTKLLLTLVAFTVRTYIYRLHLYNSALNDKKKNYMNEINLADTVLGMISHILFKTCKLYSKKYRFTYYKSFKLCIFLDYFKEIYNDGSLYNHLFQTKKNFDTDTPLPENILNHKLMKMVFAGDFITTLLKGLFDILMQDQVQDFLKDKSDTRTSSTGSTDYENEQEEEKRRAHDDDNFVFDSFSFEALFKNSNFDDFDFFDKDFF